MSGPQTDPKHHCSRSSRMEDEEKEDVLVEKFDETYVMITRRKRRKVTITPSERASVLMKGLQTLFHFLIHIESSNGRFNLRDAIRHAFMRQHAEQVLTWI